MQVHITKEKMNNEDNIQMTKKKISTLPARNLERLTI